MLYGHNAAGNGSRSTSGAGKPTNSNIRHQGKDIP